MSLKAFHILFIVVSTALALGFGAWCMQIAQAHGDAGYRVAAIASFVVAVALGGYGFWFWQKLRRWEDDVASSKTSPLRGAPGRRGDDGPHTAPYTGV